MAFVKLKFFCFFKWANPGLFLVYFRSFQTNIVTIFTTNKCEKCPSSIRCQDSNSQPSDYESTHLTTRPGLPPIVKLKFQLSNSFVTCVELSLVEWSQSNNFPSRRFERRVKEIKSFGNSFRRISVATFAINDGSDNDILCRYSPQLHAKI